MVMGLLMVLLPSAAEMEGPFQYKVPAPVFWINDPALLAQTRLLVTRQSPEPSNKRICTTPPPDWTRTLGQMMFAFVELFTRSWTVLALPGRQMKFSTLAVLLPS